MTTERENYHPAPGGLTDNELDRLCTNYPALTNVRAAYELAHTTDCADRTDASYAAANDAWRVYSSTARILAGLDDRPHRHNRVPQCRHVALTWRHCCHAPSSRSTSARLRSTGCA